MNKRRFSVACSGFVAASLASACEAPAERESVTLGVSTQALSEKGAASAVSDHWRPSSPEKEAMVEHVLLLSVDGLHESDLSGFIAAHPDSALAKLARQGVQYQKAFVNRLDGSPNNPSDSFPGLLALLTGGSSRTSGVWYDVSYARDLYPDRTCTTRGTAVAYDEGAEIDNAGLWGVTGPSALPTHEPSVVRSRLDVAKLPYRKTPNGCEPVYPHDFLRTNTVFEVAHAAGLHTAWSDKHLAYELVTGPSGQGLDDLFAPEINSAATNLPGTEASAGEDFTTKAAYTAVYDDFKVGALLREIDGEWSDAGLAGATDADTHPGVPALFGMNFQAVSVAQKDAIVGPGGYQSPSLEPSDELEAALEHTDASIGMLLDELDAHQLRTSTLVVVTAKHGQSPIDPATLRRRDGDAIIASVDRVAKVQGSIADDVALLWLADSTQTAAARAALRAAPADGSPLDPNIARLLSANSRGFEAMFGDPTQDPRTPDLVVQPESGVIYSLSTKKQEEHGGFAEADSHVALLFSLPAFTPTKIETPVRTAQVAPTILSALGLDPDALEAVRREGTETLPDFPKHTLRGHEGRRHR
jgi:hypothetical protein